MNDKIISIEANLPHKISVVICLKCYKRWVANRPQTVKLFELECSKCGQGFVIETGEIINS